MPERYELAMEASLGARLQLLLSESSDQTMGAVDYLKTQKHGRSSFLSGDLAGVAVESTQADIMIRQEEGFRDLLKDVVSLPETVKLDVAQFFKDIVIVDSIRTALRLRTNYPDRTFVTIEGDTLSVDGDSHWRDFR